MAEWADSRNGLRVNHQLNHQPTARLPLATGIPKQHQYLYMCAHSGMAHFLNQAEILLPECQPEPHKALSMSLHSQWIGLIELLAELSR